MSETPDTAPGWVPSLSTAGARAAFAARCHIGIPFRVLGRIEDGHLDDVGLVQRCLYLAGAPLGYWYAAAGAVGLWGALRPLPDGASAQPGDVLCWGAEPDGRPIHVAIVTATDSAGAVVEIVEASPARGRVRVASPFERTDKFLGARRVPDGG